MQWNLPDNLLKGSTVWGTLDCCPNIVSKRDKLMIYYTGRFPASASALLWGAVANFETSSGFLPSGLPPSASDCVCVSSGDKGGTGRKTDQLLQVVSEDAIPLHLPLIMHANNVEYSISLIQPQFKGPPLAIIMFACPKFGTSLIMHFLSLLSIDYRPMPSSLLWPWS